MLNKNKKNTTFSSLLPNDKLTVQVIHRFHLQYIIILPFKIKNRDLTERYNIQIDLSESNSSQFWFEWYKNNFVVSPNQSRIVLLADGVLYCRKWLNCLKCSILHLEFGHVKPLWRT